MINVILADIVGSRFEFISTQETEVKLFHPACSWTDDTVCTYAVSIVCEKIKNKNLSEEEIKKLFFLEFKRAVNEFPMAGYGKSFKLWLNSKEYKENNSAANGSLMRISQIPLYFDNIEEIQKIGRLCTETSHNHKDSLKATQIYLEMLYQLKKDISNDFLIKKEKIKKIAKDNNLEVMSVENYHKIGGYWGLAIDTLPRAISCFLNANNFTEMCKNVLYIGSDTDTTAAISAALIELTYGLNNEEIKELYRFFNHKSFKMVNQLVKPYCEFKSELSHIYQYNNIEEIKKLKNYIPKDPTAEWDPLEMPSDEEYYKNKKEISFIEKLVNFLNKKD